MYPSAIALVAVAVLPALASAANTVKFINHCSHPFWFWVVGPSPDRPAHHDPAAIMVPSNGGSTIHHLENTEVRGGGVALKVRDLPKYEHAPAGIMQIEYTLEPSKNEFWYDLSAVNCNIHVGPEDSMYCPLLEGGFRLNVTSMPGDNCPNAWCKHRRCHNTYTKPGSWKNEPSFKCSVGSETTIQTCTDGPARRTIDKDAKAGVPYPESVHPEPMTISPDQTCGARAGFTCEGSPWGQCCSQWGFCGNTMEHCDNTCQSAFGNCDAYKASSKPLTMPMPSTFKTIVVKPTASPTPLKISPDGNCGADFGYTCAGSEKGDCCSSYGFCGTSDLYCGAGCQPAFGICPGDDYTKMTDLPAPALTPETQIETEHPSRISSLFTTSAPTPYPNPKTETESLETSTDGSCGAEAGFTCLSSTTGRCCSSYNFCGITSDHCGSGCQSDFGECDHVEKRQERPKSWMGIPVAHPTKAPEWVGVDGKTRPLSEIWRGGR